MRWSLKHTKFGKTQNLTLCVCWCWNSNRWQARDQKTFFTNENRHAWSWWGSSTEKRSHFRGAKSFASPPQLVWTAGEPVPDLAPTFKWCKYVSCFCLKHARRAKTMANCFIVHRARHAKRARASINDQWGYLTDQLWDRRLACREFWKKLDAVRKLLFPFARAPAKCVRKGPSMHAHWGISVRQTPRVLRLRSSFGRAGKPTIALKWRGRTNQAKLKRCGPTRVGADA